MNLECGRCGQRLYSDLCDFKESDGSQPHLDREIYTNQAPDTGWWFGTFFFFQYIGNVIIPTDELHHSEGWRKKHQPGQLDEFDRCEDQLLGEMFLQLQPQLSQPVFSN